jgi:protein AroM
VKLSEEQQPRIGVITIGRSPRPDVLAELMRRLEAVQYDEFATFDEVSDETLAKHVPEPDDAVFFARLAENDHVVLSVDFVERQVERLVARVDQLNYDLIVVAATALFAPLRTRTPIVHGQRAVDAWMSAFVSGNLTIGLVYPLSQQGGQLATFNHATQLRSAHASLRGGYSERLTEAAAGVSAADLIVMHSVGYTESMALQVARETNKPVVTARWIIAAAIQLRLGEIMGRFVGSTVDGYTGVELLKNLTEARTVLTPREQEVMAQALEGKPNKVIGRVLNISYRTVELHRARAMAKLGANSVTELIRRALI